MAFDRDDDILCDDTIYYLYPLPPAPPAGEIRSTALGGGGEAVCVRSVAVCARRHKLTYLLHHINTRVYK